MKYNSSKYIGLQSGYLTVVSYDNGKFSCQCKCGRMVKADPWSIVNQKKKSCSSRECAFFHRCESEASTSHGLTGNRLYTIWNNMIARCHHPQNPNYRNYGARGVSVCEEWRLDVQTFIEWATLNGYNDNLTIDRIDVNGNYEPANCRWVDYKIQSENKRHYNPTPRKATKHIWTIQGETKSGVEWCKLYGVSFPTVIYRIRTFGVSPLEALTMENKQSGRPRKE
jgi:hypothetical protein